MATPSFPGCFRVTLGRFNCSIRVFIMDSNAREVFIDLDSLSSLVGGATPLKRQRDLVVFLKECHISPTILPQIVRSYAYIDSCLFYSLRDLAGLRYPNLGYLDLRAPEIFAALHERLPVLLSERTVNAQDDHRSNNH